MKISIKIILMSVTLSGCVTNVRTMRGPNGKDAHAISCKHGVENCYQAASELCPDGYNLLNSGQTTKGYVSTGTMVVPVSQDNIFIECK